MEVFNELIKYEPNFLDRPLEDLVPLRFLGAVAVDAYRALIKRIDNIPMAQEERDAKLADGQDAGKALLTIESKIGELSLTLPQVHRGGRSSEESKGLLKHEKLNMSRKALDKAQSISNHPEEVQEVIKEAEENEDIPTKGAVFNKIKAKRDEEKIQSMREQTVDYEVKPDLPSFLEDCITNQNQVNIVLKEILQNPDQIESDRMAMFINELQNTINMLKNFQEGNEKWKRLQLTM